MALGSVRVLVLVDGTYLLASRTEAVEAARGNIIEIGSGWYIDSVVAKGLVHYLQANDNIEKILADTEPVEDDEPQETTSVEDGVIVTSTRKVRKTPTV